MPAPPEIHELVNRFEENLASYISGSYNETQLRREFIDPLFEALGWDVDNKAGHAEAYKDVIHEDAIRIGGAMKAPDYCFRIGGTRKFFVEAKKPAVDIAGDPAPAYQLRRYAWSAGLPLSILTHFDALAVYDCRIKPNHADRPSKARILYIEFRDYARRWDEIAAIFSKESVLKGSFDRYAESGRTKKGTAGVDEAFLQEIESWRDLLARNIALRNTDLSQRELNTAVTLTINRIIFLRICEDRGIEPYGQLQALLNGAGTYQRLVGIFQRADDRYNSGLFHFRKEKDRTAPPDGLTLSLAIDDKTLKEILRSLYYPESPYEFSVLPADILGRVYEQFLGKIIRLTAGHQAKVEDKPEVKKAGGVFYTPQYIVDHIVGRTVGRLLEGRTPAQADKFRIIDPACGSGSFLIQAYQCLLDWYRDRYIEAGPEKRARGRKPLLYQAAKGDWRLTTAERKRILLNGIYGVDIDPQAVEVTKLSLLLKVLEGESGETLTSQLNLFHERALPDLSANIRCGNSLIGSDFFDDELPGLFNEEDRYRINVFDWPEEFPEVFAAGGFDTVIGNPPYIRIQTMKEWAPLEVEFYKTAFMAAGKGNYDIYVTFVEKGMGLLNPKGRLGFILPHKFFNAQYGEPLRALLAKGRHLAEIVHFGDAQVFSGATTYTCLLFLDKAGSGSCRFTKVGDLDTWRQTGEGTEGHIPAKQITAAEWNFTVGHGADLFEKLRRMPVKLRGVIKQAAQGLRTSANEVYVLDMVSSKGDVIIAHSKRLQQNVELERESISLFLQGREIRPYRTLPSGKVVIIPYRQEIGHAMLIPAEEYQEMFPRTFAYLCANKKHLEERERGRMQGLFWYAYVYPKNIDIMGQPKILVPDIANRASFALDETGEYAFTSGYGIILKSTVNESHKYMLGLLNSKLLDFFLKKISTTMRGGFFRYFTQFIEQLPVRRIDFTDPSDQDRHNRMVAMVEEMLSLHQQLVAARTEHEKMNLRRRIDATDRRIDRLVYDLYDLTDAEIRTIET